MKKIVSIGIIFLFFYLSGTGQGISFSHLNTSNGLSDNNVQCLAIDKKGFLWIGTPDGLNVYDGYNITTYHRTNVPTLPSDTIRQLFCDSRNRLWMLFDNGVAWASDERKFKKVLLFADSAYRCYAVIETAAYGMILFTNKGHYYFDERSDQWKKIGWLSDIISNSHFNTARSFSSNKGIYVYEGSVVIVDYGLQKKIFEQKIEHAVTACPFNEGNMVVCDRYGTVMIIDISTQQVLKHYELLNDAKGDKSGIAVSEISKAANGNLLIASGRAGLFMIDSITGTISSFKHNAIDPTSISGNIQYRILTGKNGEIITGSPTSGVNIFNINNRKAAYKTNFTDPDGNIFDGHFNEIAEDKDHIMWIGCADRLMRWDRQNNSSTFYKYNFTDEQQGTRNLEIRCVYVDSKDRIWIGTTSNGLSLFNRHTGSFQLITKDTSIGNALHSGYINDIVESSDGKIWACSYSGMYNINPDNHKITSFRNDLLLKGLAENKVIISIFEDSHKRIWVGTQRFGVYCYNSSTRQLLNYTTSNGLIANTGYSITEDRFGNIYVAATTGFSIIAPDGNIRNITKDNGLRYSHCYSIIRDDNGDMWIANNKCLVKFIPSSNRFEYFEENAGISMDGFRYGAVCKTSDGNLCWGTYHGINYFNPANIRNYTAQLSVNINQVIMPDSVSNFINSPVIKANYSRNSIQFHFAAINLTGSRNIVYRYMLEGYDKTWQTGIDLRVARYSSLPPGHYVFKVSASIDRVNWTESNNTVTIDIIPPLWKRSWFIAAMVLLLSGLIVVFFRFRIGQVRYNEKLKTIYNKKISETEMKALRAQMNPHFIFNSLNSINRYILTSDHATASKYLTRFAKLIRLILDNSNSREVALSSELEALKLYIDMESLRFTDKFTYEIKIDGSVNPETILVPPLIIQPYVENAIWHGLLHKKAGGHLAIRIKKIDDNVLHCEIEDNGVGRKKANELRSKSVTTKKSLGMKLTEERISMLNQYSSLNASIEIIDLENGSGEATGTKVIVTIPI